MRNSKPVVLVTTRELRARRKLANAMGMHGVEMAIVATSAASVLVYIYLRHQKRAASPPPEATAATEVAPPAAEEVAQPAVCRMAPKGKRFGSSVMLKPPSLCASYQLEYSVHTPSRLLRRDIELVFRPDLEDAYQKDPRGAAAGIDKDEFLREYLLALPTWQPSKHDLSEIAFEVNEERRGLLANFDVWAERVRPKLGAYWSDVSCPMEGHSRYGTPTSCIYNELEGLTSLLRYDSIPIGCCGIVLHPKWQRKAYPVTFFTLCPMEEVVKVIEEVERQGR